MKVQEALDILYQLKDSITKGVPHDLNGKQGVPRDKAQKDKIQAELNESFDIWRDTWIYPRIRHLETLLQEERNRVNKLKKRSRAK